MWYLNVLLQQIPHLEGITDMSSNFITIPAEMRGNLTNVDTVAEVDSIVTTAQLKQEIKFKKDKLYGVPSFQRVGCSLFKGNFVKRAMYDGNIGKNRWREIMIKDWNQLLMKYHNNTSVMWFLLNIAEIHKQPVGTFLQPQINVIKLESSKLSGTELNKLKLAYKILKEEVVVRIKPNHYLINPCYLIPAVDDESTNKPFSIAAEHWFKLTGEQLIR